MEQKDGMYVFCDESKVGNWVVSHILLVVGSIFLFLSILSGLIEGKIFLLQGLVVTAFMLGMAILFRILWRNMCCRIEIDTANGKIRFFRFYKKVVEAPVRSVEFCFLCMFTCFYLGEKFTIPGGYINSIAEVLPEGVEIKFSKGILGRLAENQFEKNRQVMKK